MAKPGFVMGSWICYGLVDLTRKPAQNTLTAGGALMRITRFVIVICGLVLIAGCEGDSGNGAASSGGGTTPASDPCAASPSPGDVCDGGAIYLGELTPGAISGGTVTDHYMTTPGGCTDSATPTCSGTDTLTKVWYGTGGSYANIAALVDYTATTGTGNGAINKDQNYGDDNTAAILADASIGTDSAAAYCDNLVYGGYSDWYLPNRYELNLFYTNAASIPGLDTSGNYYWSSTEYISSTAWSQGFSDGDQTFTLTGDAWLVRCVRRYQ